ncbi:MAG: S8 family serine peptidase, partial [Candidatus Thorarchaeota archaeon]
TNKISARLSEKMASIQSSELIPIVVQFPDESESDWMRYVIEASDIDVVVRHVFHMIPMVSLYATSDEITTLATFRDVKLISLDTKVSIDTEISDQGAATATNGSGYQHPNEVLGVEELWAQGYNGNGITVAILDSGADALHPDLQDSLVGFRDFINDQEDLDPSDGIDAYDDNGHGTACAWLVAGSGDDNGGNYTGMAPGADLLIIKILDAIGNGEESVIAAGIEYAVDHDADVISLSVGASWWEHADPSIAMAQEAVSQGVTVVIAAGNEGPSAFTMNSPGVTQEVITVGASAGAEGVAGFSSRGPVANQLIEPYGYFAKPDLVAPGYNVFSGRAIDAAIEFPIYNESQYDSSYTLWSGTSASTPQIAGLAALLLDKHAALTPIETKTALMSGATDLGADPMAQGWGLANATRASEILEASSRQLTIVTPKRYPTLPGGSNVFIVGDERTPQNVTVLSTVNRGTLDIEMTGNVSQFIAVDESVAVTVGYSYFTIRLEVPADLSLNAVGPYEGQLRLFSGAETFATMDLNLTIIVFGGRLLVDMAHHSYDDPDDPSLYQYFREYLEEQGVLMEEFSSPGNPQPIDSAALATADTFMIMDTETPYDTDEIDALHQLVEEGGTLLVMSEYYNSTDSTAAFAMDSYNEILAPYGIECEEYEIGVGSLPMTGEVYGTDHGGAVENHSLVEGVNNLYITWGSTLHVDDSIAGAQGLLWVDEAKTHAIVATVDYGLGRVIVVSDGSILYDTWLYDAIRKDADNLRLLRNIASSLLSVKPKIFDVEMKAGRIGEPANVTAFVFSDNIEEVTIEVYAPNGMNITGAATETLGYRFSQAFTLEIAGFYDVRIVATDTDGNTRIVERTFMVQVDFVPDEVVIGVMVALFAVVVAGLGYVGVKHFGIGKRRKRRAEREWEISVGKDEPPAIQ